MSNHRKKVREPETDDVLVGYTFFVSFPFFKNQHQNLFKINKTTLYWAPTATVATSPPAPTTSVSTFIPASGISLVHVARENLIAGELRLLCTSQSFTNMTMIKMKETWDIDDRW